MSKYDNLNNHESYKNNKSKEKTFNPATRNLVIGLITASLFFTGCDNEKKVNLSELDNNNPTTEAPSAITTELIDADQITTENSNINTSNNTTEKTSPTETVKPIENTAVDTQETTETIDPTELIELESFTKNDETLLESTFLEAELVDYSKAPVDLVESYSFKYLTPEQQATLKEYQSMELSEFRELSNLEQLTYAQYVLENNRERFELMLKKYDIDCKYTDLVNNHGELLDNFRYINMFIANLYIQNPDNKDCVMYDENTGFKLMSLYQLSNLKESYVESYDEKINYFNTLTTHNMYDFKVEILESINTEITETNTGSYLGIIANIELTGSQRINYSDPKKQVTFQLTPITTIQGKNTEISQLIKIVNMDNASDISE